MKQNDMDTDIIVPYDGGDIFIERVAELRENIESQALVAQVDTCSGIKTNVQRTVYQHSPTGFNFGYGGSGPADLALNILLMFAEYPDQITRGLYQHFKFKYCATETEPGKLVIKLMDIIDFLNIFLVTIKHSKSYGKDNNTF